MSSSLEAMRAQVEQFAQAMLPADPRSWCQQYDRHRTKIIHDALWGTHKLRAHEIALLDTPLLQRLRYIHQTGAVYLTYPSALHTRFEHSLGVFFQAGRMFAVLRERAGADRFDQNTENNVRFAALMHDTGHGPFSHSSEQFFSSMDDMASVREDDEEYAGGGSGAGEILSSLLVQSQAFAGFVGELNSHFHVRISTDLVQRMITGNVEPQDQYLTEIIHGPLDADKLDYMHRDGMFSGLRLHVDLDRLYASINVAEQKRDKFTIVRIGGSVAGTSPLEQIMFNKMILFTGIYHHHKVRAVDCMLWAMFMLAAQRKAAIGGRVINNCTDFLYVTDDKLLCEELSDDKEIQQLILAVRYRRLWKRALVIARITAENGMYDAETGPAKGPLADLTTLAGNEREKIRRRRWLSDRIWEVAGKPCASHEVWLDIPSLPSMGEAKRMWISAPGTDEVQELQDFVPITQLVENYGTHKWRAHVFCPSHVRETVANAALKVLDEEFGLKLKSLAKQFAGIKV